jgi:hypothetical protein
MSYPLLPPDMEPDDLEAGHLLDDGGHDLPDPDELPPPPEPGDQLSDTPEE